MKLSLRTWLSIVTLVLIVALIVLAWDELLVAWKLMSQVNLWILALFIPVVLLNYFASGEMIFSYLRKKKRIDHVSPFEQIRMSLEMNFVNHVLPSGGASGVSYMTWRLGKHHVPPSHATMAQAVRFAAGFAGFSIMLIVAVVAVTIDSGVNRSIILISSTLVGLMVAATFGAIYMLKDLRRVRKASAWLTSAVNYVVRKATFGKKRRLLKAEVTEAFLVDMHDDYLELKRDKRLLIRPIVWAIIFTCTDIAMYFIAFWSLGTIVNPAVILIAYGLATIAGFIVITPGGSGAYEVLMVGFLVATGVSQSVALAGVILARVIILVVIILIGYIFYQHALVKYGGKKKDGKTSIQRQ